MKELQSLCFFCMDLHFINIIKTVCLQQQQKTHNIFCSLSSIPTGNTKTFPTLSNINMSTSLVLLSGNEKRKEIKKSFASPAVRKACVKTAGCNVTYLNLSRVSHKENAARTFCLLGRSNNAALSAPINTSFWVTQRPEVIDFPT